MKPRSLSLRPRLRVLRGDVVALGPGKIRLLMLLAETGSIREAADRMEMSYMRAWSMVKTMNACFKEPLVVSTRGGSAHGGARLTAAGLKVLSVYQQIEKKSLAAVSKEWVILKGMLRS